MRPRLIFVDGPTGVGKDFFIEYFIKEYSKRYPNNTIKVVVAKDIVFNENTLSEDRKYISYTTDIEKCDNIFIGHIKLLMVLYKLLFSTDVILINRSFLSFLAYNVESANISIDKKNYYIENYSELFNEMLKNVYTVFVNLDIVSFNYDDKIKTIISRLDFRSDNKKIEKEWIEEIVDRYSEPEKRIINLFNFFETISSDGYSYILNKYF